MFPVYEEKKENLHFRSKTSRHASPHLHNSIEFIYITEGTLELGMRQELYHMEKGGLFLDTKTEVEIVAMARDYMFWNSLFFIPLGALIVWRYTIQGLGYSTLAMMAGVAEMVARTVIGLVLIPVLGFFGAELANPAAWVAACLFLYPAYLWTVKHLENRLLAGHLAMQHSAVGD